MNQMRYWLGFNRVPRIGPVRLRNLLNYFGDIETAWHADRAQLRAAQLSADAIEKLVAVRAEIDLDAQMERVERAGIHLVCWDSPDYPELLKHSDQPPPLLYVRGSLEIADELAVAIVGTRTPTSYGKDVTRKLTYELARNQVTIVSGLALGIDGVAHETALEAGGRTLAVLGCGLDYIYPASHRALAERITSQGALISDYPLGTKPEANNFPPRNRIISGLALGTVVTEAGLGSGALITLKYANEQGRDLFAVPGSIFNRASAGANQAIANGEAKMVCSIEDILGDLNLNMVMQQEAAREVIPDTPTERLIANALGPEPLHIDDIVRETRLPTAEVVSTLVVMELKGSVRRADNARYVIGSTLHQGAL
ncbi:MAG: DNA-protecting protein DprA [Chloroflexi bacterium]|nr:DNA-protecting protein DprA [Chloroflexota bacterium]